MSTTRRSDGSKSEKTKEKKILGDLLQKLIGKIDDSKLMELLRDLLDYTKEQVSLFRSDLVTLAKDELEETKRTVDLRKEVMRLLSMMTIEVKMQVRLVPNESVPDSGERTPTERDN